MIMSRHSHSRSTRAARGIVLIDALVAIVIFSICIVGMVSLQASAVTMTSGANYRINAAMLTDQVIAQMWGDTSSVLIGDFQGSNGSGGTKYTSWASAIDCGSTNPSTNCLPGAKANPPSIAITTTSASRPNDYQVTVTVYWKAPDDPNTHQYVAITQIGQ